VSGGRTGWQYALAGLFIASIAAVISYNDGLFVARLAGNHDRQAFLYPFLPDGLIVVGLLALLEAARRGIPRSRWATGAVLLGVAMTLAMNAGAGIAHSALDAVMDGLVPVAFFVAAEVVLWHVRRGRGAVPAQGSPAASPGTVPPSSFEAAKARMRQAADLNFRYTDNQAREDFHLTRAAAAEARRQVNLERSRGGASAAPAPAAQDAPAGALVTHPHGVPPAGAAAMNVPAGEHATPPPAAPAGTLNGQAGRV
jgi:hypothetical protein